MSVPNSVAVAEQRRSPVVLSEEVTPFPLRDDLYLVANPHIRPSFRAVMSQIKRRQDLTLHLGEHDGEHLRARASLVERHLNIDQGHALPREGELTLFARTLLLWSNLLRDGVC